MQDCGGHCPTKNGLLLAILSVATLTTGWLPVLLNEQMLE